MKRLIPLCACVLSIAAGACTNATTRGDASSGEARIVGTVLDAATGAPEAHVKVEGPDGKSTQSDASGRFMLAGLAPGTDGEVTARTSDGRSARVRLRRLAAGAPLEVVLQLATH